MLIGLRTGPLTQRAESQHLKTSEKESHSKKTRALQEGEHVGRQRWGHKTAVPGPSTAARDPPLRTKPGFEPSPQRQKVWASLWKAGWRGRLDTQN